jgi:hypothetical protein
VVDNNSNSRHIACYNRNGLGDIFCKCQKGADKIGLTSIVNKAKQSLSSSQFEIGQTTCWLCQ